MHRDITGDLEELPKLLRTEDSNLVWSSSIVNDESCFHCLLAMSSGTFSFCFVPSVEREPYVALLSPQDLQEQSQDQGFLGRSIDQIRVALRQQSNDPSSALSFRTNHGTVELSINVSSALRIHLKATVVHIDTRASSAILRRLLDDVLAGSYLLEKLSSSRVKILESKDKAIEFLRENLEEVGDRQVLSRWAPRGSINYQALEKYDDDTAKNATFAGVEVVPQKYLEARTANTLFRLRKEMKQYKKSNPSSPSKRKATKLPSDFAPSSELEPDSPHDEGMHDDRLVKIEGSPSLIKEESLSAELSPTSSRETSRSPNKKRKFRKVKITKERSA